MYFASGKLLMFLPMVKCFYFAYDFSSSTLLLIFSFHFISIVSLLSFLGSCCFWSKSSNSAFGHVSFVSTSGHVSSNSASGHVSSDYAFGHISFDSTYGHVSSDYVMIPLTRVCLWSWCLLSELESSHVASDLLLHDALPLIKNSTSG